VKKRQQHTPDKKKRRKKMKVVPFFEISFAFVLVETGAVTLTTGTCW